MEQLNESGRWRARDVSYVAGRWDQVSKLIPEFTTEDFKADKDKPTNPYLKTIVRQPLNKLEHMMPVTVVSKTYTLAGHRDVAFMCIEAVRQAGIETDFLRCELGMTEFGERMNFIIYFPSEFDYIPGNGEKLGLRVECFNSVDGSSRLAIIFGWFRFVCANGMVIGETRANLRDIHNKSMDLGRISKIIDKAMMQIQIDLEQMKQWESTEFLRSQLEVWTNTSLSEAWGKKLRAVCITFALREMILSSLILLL